MIIEVYSVSGNEAHKIGSVNRFPKSQQVEEARENFNGIIYIELNDERVITDIRIYEQIRKEQNE